MLLPSTWTCRASRADWLAFEARPRVRLVLTAVRPEVGRDEAFRCGEVRGESVGGEIRWGRQGADLPLQRSDGCGVGPDVGSVLGGCLEGRVLSQDEGELPGGDALQLDHRRLGDAVIEDVPGEGGREE